MASIKRNWIVFLLIGLGALTHFAYFGHPNKTVFDEVHFGKFINGYLTGEYFFDIHPPLGKLILSGAGYLSGFKPGFSFADIGSVFPDKQYMALRFLPSLAGSFLPLVIYFVALNLGFSRRGSLLAGLFVAFENALVVQSRFILLDSFLLLFGFLSVLFYLKFRNSTSNQQPKTNYQLPTTNYQFLAGFFAALAGLVKWTGFGFLFVILIFQIYDLFSAWNFRKALRGFLFLILIPAAVYLSVFALHFYLLPKSGPGDSFMTSSFQKTLAGNRHQGGEAARPIGFFSKFVELNAQMYGSNKRITPHHPYGSKWYTWPFMVKSVYFWNDKSGNLIEDKIYLLGNPFIWWSSTVAILLMMLNFGRSLIQRTKLEFGQKLILSGFFANLLPFIGIGRVMFVYHYFTSLIFAILALAYFVDRENKKGLNALFVILSVVFFFYFVAFTYGLPMSVTEEKFLFWLPTWR